MLGPVPARPLWAVLLLGCQSQAGTGCPLPTPRRAFRAGFVAGLNTQAACSPGATGTAASGPWELLVGLVATSGAGPGPQALLLPLAGTVPGSASPHQERGQLASPVRGPGDCLHLLSLADLVSSLLKTVTNSPAAGTRGTKRGCFQGCRDGSGLQERAGAGMQFTVQALDLQLGTAGGRGAAEQGPAVRVASSTGLPEAGVIAQGGLGM